MTATRRPPPPSASKRVLFVAVVLAAAGVASGLVAEVALRATGVGPTIRLAGDFPPLVVDFGRLYRMLPRGTREINARGYRGADFGPRVAGVERILFLGDSMIFGPNVAPERTIPAELQRQIAERAEVLNLGVYGYGPDQSLLQLVAEGLALDPDRVILGVFPANDFADVLKNQLVAPWDDDVGFRLRERHLLDRTVSPWRIGVWLRFWGLRAGLDGAGFDALVQSLLTDSYDHELMRDPSSEGSRERIAVMEAVLREARRGLEARGFPLTVVVIPSLDNTADDTTLRALAWATEEVYFANEQAIVDLCERVGIDVLDLSRPIRDHPDGAASLWELDDGHLSPAGTRFAAERIHDHLAQVRSR